VNSETFARYQVTWHGYYQVVLLPAINYSSLFRTFREMEVFARFMGLEHPVRVDLIFYNGWDSPSGDRGHGHGIYTQNQNGTKTLDNNFIFRARE
jgi:hypothetical protein